VKHLFRKGLCLKFHSPFSLFEDWKSSWMPVALCCSLLLASCAGIMPSWTKSDRTSSSVADTTKGAPSYNSESISHYMDGVTAEMQGNYAMAVLDFQEALQADSTSSTIYMELGNAYRALHKFDQSLRVFQLGLKNTGEKEEFLPSIGETSLLLGNTKQAEAAFQRFIQITKDTDKISRAYARLADIYLQQKEYEKVAQTYEKLYNLGPDRQEYLLKAQNIYARLGKYKEVRKLISLLQQDYPNDQEYKLDLAKFFSETDKPDSAIHILKPLVKNDPQSEAALLLGELYFKTANLDSTYIDSAYSTLKPLVHGDSTDVRVLYYLGGITLNMRKYDESESYYRMVLKQQDSLLGGYYGLGVVLRAEEKYNSAVNILNQGIEKFPKEPELYEQLGMSYYLMNKYDSSKVNLTHALKLDSTLLRPKHFLAFVYDQLGQQDSAAVMYKDLIAAVPGEPLYKNNLAYLYAQEGVHLDVALQLVDSALVAEPDNSSYLDTKGWIYYQMGNYQSAREFVSRALQDSQDNAEVMEHLGDIYSKLGNTDMAREYYQRALKIKPDNQALKKKIQ